MRKREILNSLQIWVVILAIAILIWFGDSLIDKMFFYTESFEEISVTNVPILEIYFRSALIVLLFIIGFIVMRRSNEKSRAKELIGFEREQTLKIFDSIDEPIYIVDTKTYEILYTNEKVKKLFGDIHGMKCHQYFVNEKNPCMNCDLSKFASNEIDISSTREFYNPLIDRWFHCIDKKIKWIDGRDAVYTLHIDITDKKKMEREYFNASKLETLEVMSETIVHDFNNILTTMVMSLSIAKNLTEKEEKVQSLISMAEEAAFRAKDITHQMLTFTKSAEPMMEHVKLEQAIKHTVDFILKNSQISYKVIIGENLPYVEADVGQITQVMNNLIINAKQSLKENGNIEVRIESESVSKRMRLPIDEGNYLKITVSDNGDGISPENIEKIFDPYFTTKAEGYGLGLASCYIILTRHNGYIHAESKLGKGSSFYVYIPASIKSNAPDKKEDEISSLKSFRTLIIDDDEIVSNVTAMMMNYKGEMAEIANTIEKAVSMIREKEDSNDPYEVIIMDNTLPDNRDPKEVLAEMKRDGYKGKFLLLLSIDSIEVKEEFSKAGFDLIIAKPVKADALIKEIVKILKSLKSH